MLNDRSLRALAGVHPDLVRVVHRAAEITAQPFIVTEGLRTLARQKQLVAAGTSRTLHSRHLTGHAVDVAALAGGHVCWDDKLYAPIAAAMKQAGHELGVPVEWGAEVNFAGDTPHFQLPWKSYPATDRAAHVAAHVHQDAAALADSWHTETVAAINPPAPPASMTRSTTGNTAVLQGGAGVALKADAMADAFTEVAQSATDFSLEAFAFALLRSPKFWVGLFLVASSAYVWLERRAKLITWGI